MKRIKKLIRVLSKWAWKEELDRRYTAFEVAQWLSEYHGRYREIPMTLWIQQYRDKHNS